jgi:hypothetical protein
MNKTPMRGDGFMKKLVMVLMLVMCLVTVSVSAWGMGPIVKGDVIYGDPEEPKK